MVDNAKYTTTIRLTKAVREKLRKQAKKLGMDMSNYIAFLVMYKEEKDKQEETAKDLLRTIIDAYRNGTL